MPKKEKIYKAGLGDPRSGPERLVGLFNRVASGNKNSPARYYDDTPEQMAAKRKASKPVVNKPAPKRKKKGK